MSDRIVIVGGGVAAARLVRVYREAGGDAALTMLAAERHRPYNRPPLSKAFLRGELPAADVFVEPASAYEDLQVDVHLEATATGVDTAGRRITIADGSEIPYDRLVLASGSVPRELGVPGEQLEGVHTYRGLDDAAAVDAAVSSAERALVIGAGFIGMETAASLRRRGLQVTVIEPAESLFSALRHPGVSASLATLYRQRGVDVILRDTVSELHGAGGRLEGAVTRAGATIEAQLAIVGVGVEPATSYLRGTEIALDRGSVVVDEHFQSSNPHVWAIGDLASFHDPVAGHRRLAQHWTNATHQGERLGLTLAGRVAPYDQVAYFFTELFGTKLGLLGDLGAGVDQRVTSGNLETGLISYYLRGNDVVAALISGQTPETQAAITSLLRSHGSLGDIRAVSPVPELAEGDGILPAHQPV